MYKLIIIDDEYEIRYGLSSYFPWEEIGFTIVGSFESPLPALEYLEMNHVDTILTDIKMPKMTGLELARKLHEERHPARVVFLTGYKEFDFLKESIEYKVYNYLLKPITYREIRKTFGRLKEELDAALQNETELPEKNPELQPGIERLKAYIEENFATTGLEDAAAFMHMSPNYLSRYFKTRTSENFSDYLLKLKMFKAVELMKNLELKTYHISEMVGYNNPNNFTRAFKKIYGKTPKEFRDPHE